MQKHLKENSEITSVADELTSNIYVAGLQLSLIFLIPEIA
jgi:hypothetical protein